jgi:hypothetical protein
MGTIINTVLGLPATFDALENLRLGPYRPPQWNKPPMVTITVPNQQSNTQSSNDADGGFILRSNNIGQTTYVFDTVLSLEHDQRLEKTQHPIQNGANISSHAYLMPARLVLYVGMSDCMAAFSSGSNPTKPPYITPFSGNPSKSVSAYQQMIALQASRQPLTIGTRLRTYRNMIVTSVSPREDSRTIAGLKMRVEFEQIFTASISTTSASARPQDTGATGLGGVNTQAPNSATTSQFNVSNTLQPPSLLDTPSTVQVPGAGTWSSINVNSLQKILP